MVRVTEQRLTIARSEGKVIQDMIPRWSKWGWLCIAGVVFEYTIILHVYNTVKGVEHVWVECGDKCIVLSPGVP